MTNDKIHKTNILNVNIKNYTECGWCSDNANQEILSIPWAIWSQWLYISQRMGKREWGAVYWVKDYIVTGFKIPRQEISSVDCEFKEELGGDGIIHSHHNMEAFHSSQDDTHARNLYQYSIVLTNSDGYVATKRVKLPCGAFGYVQMSLKIVELPEVDLTKIDEKNKELVVEHPERESVQHAQLDELEMNCEDCVKYDCHNCEIFLTMQEIESGMSFSEAEVGLLSKNRKEPLR